MDLATEELTLFGNLIGLIYEGATDPTLWTKSIMPAMALYFQVPDCVLFTPLHAPRDGGYLFMYGGAQEQYDLYASKCQASDDALTNAAVERNLAFEGNVILGDELLPRQQWLESKLFTECYSSNPNLAQMMTAVVFGLDSTASMSSACSFFRSALEPNSTTQPTKPGGAAHHLRRCRGQTLTWLGNCYALPFDTQDSDVKSLLKTPFLLPYLGVATKA